ncbi:MAG: radical SAM protein [Candidatus Pacearchaeota archaeon]|jgi:MoaA/NifB/PqqE/SkfB family radical SAM enzyme
MKKIEGLNINWQIDYFCNYECPYCPILIPDKKNNKQKINPEKIHEFFKNIHNSNIVISGGEPFLFPKFVEICKSITNNNNKISIITNLSSDEIFDFANNINPESISYIRASLHLTELKKYNSKKEFIERYNYLVKKGFHVEVPIVMWPPIFKNIYKIYNEFVNKGIYLIPMSFFGEYKGKTYPEAYTRKEHELIKKLFENTVHNFKIKTNNYTEISNKKISFKGKHCSAGLIYIVILPNGNIRRCFSENIILGNIESSKELELFKEKKICISKYCLCPGEGYSFCLNDSEREKIKIKTKNKNIFNKMLNKLINNEQN